MKIFSKSHWRGAFQWIMAALTFALGLLMGAETAKSYAATGWFDISFLVALTALFGLVQTAIWFFSRHAAGGGRGEREGYTAGSSFMSILGPLVAVLLQDVATQYAPTTALTLPHDLGTALLIIMAAVTIAASATAALFAFRAAGPAPVEPSAPEATDSAAEATA